MGEKGARSGAVVSPQAVADTGLSGEVLWPLGVSLDLPPEPGNIDVEIVGFGAVFRTPYRLEKHPVGQHFVGMGDERPQEVVLRGRKMNLLIAHAHPPVLKINL